MNEILIQRIETSRAEMINIFGSHEEGHVEDMRKIIEESNK